LPLQNPAQTTKFPNHPYLSAEQPDRTLAALTEPRVRAVTVVEAIEPVIDWHRRGLLPDTVELAHDARCQLVHDDFFALVAEQ
jgi:spermidine synthase